MECLYIDASAGLTLAAITGALVDLLEKQGKDSPTFAEVKGRLEKQYHLEKKALDGVQGYSCYFPLNKEDSGLEIARQDLNQYLESLIVGPDSLKFSLKSILEALYQAHGDLANKTSDQIKLAKSTLDALTEPLLLNMKLVHECQADIIQASPINIGEAPTNKANWPVIATLLQDMSHGSSGDQSGQIDIGACLFLLAFVDEFGPRPYARHSLPAWGYDSSTLGQAGLSCQPLGIFALDLQERIERNVVEIQCNIDDMTAEALAYATKKIMAGGALDVFVTPVQMKKNRSGQLLTVTCRADQRDQLLQLIFKHTTTIGVKESRPIRHVLHRELISYPTRFGQVQAKRSRGFGIDRMKWEHDQIVELAEVHGLSLQEVLKALDQDYKPIKSEEEFDG